MRLHPTLVLFGCLGLTAGAASSAVAQRGGPSPVFTAGARGGRDFEDHAWSLGGQVGIRLQDRLEIRPSADWFLGDRTPYRWQLNGDATVTFGPGRSIYAGGGVAFVKVIPLDKVKTGYNGFFGLNFAPASARTRPFAEFRWTWVNSTSPFRVVAGVNYRLGG
jgi:hypothetical protein